MQQTPSRSYRVGASTLTLQFGDITSSAAEVLVSSDDAWLSMGGGVSAAIRRAAGQGLLLDVAKKVPAQLGDVVVTSAGALAAKHVFHAVTIGEAQLAASGVVVLKPAAIVGQATRRAIELLKALRLTSIAFPAIGSGIAGIPYEDVAVNMAEVLVDELSRSSEPLSVTIYLFDRFGHMQPLDYLQFFEEMASRTRGLSPAQLKAPAVASPAPAPQSAQQPAEQAARSDMLARLAELDAERQAQEGRLVQYGGALPRAEVHTIEARLKRIQEERIRLLSAVETPQANSAVSVFVSYSHADQDLRRELGKHLSVLERQGIIATWHDRMIGAGSEWASAIDERLDEARVILLLISADFIQSRYCYDIEMARAMERHERKDALVVPIILRAVSLQGTPFAKLQALPRDAKPVVTWPDRDTVFMEITDSLRETIRDLAAVGSR